MSEFISKYFEFLLNVFRLFYKELICKLIIKMPEGFIPAERVTALGQDRL